jgi:hypothetical protein
LAGIPIRDWPPLTRTRPTAGSRRRRHLDEQTVTGDRLIAGRIVRAGSRRDIHPRGGMAIQVRGAVTVTRACRVSKRGSVAGRSGYAVRQ